MITWDEKYVMGIDRFDKEHQQLFRTSERILNLVREHDGENDMHMFVIREGLNYIRGYFLSHAAAEEAYMREIGYEGYALHKVQHDDFYHLQLSKYQNIVDSGICRKEDVYDFIGAGVGWLLEHIATADMAIVGKGTLSSPVKAAVNEAAIENALNQLFISTLNVEMNAKIVSTNYLGEPFGKAIYHKIVYNKEGRRITLIVGLEKSIPMEVGRMLYGGDVEDEMELILSTFEIFGAQFWLSLSRQFTGYTAEIKVEENGILVKARMMDEFKKLNPTMSLLFTSDRGKFFLSCDSTEIFLPQ